MGYRRKLSGPVEREIPRIRNMAGSTSGGSGAAPDDAQYLTLAVHADLTSERIFTPGFGLTATDGGAGAAYDLVVNQGMVPTWTALHTFSAGITLNGASGANNIIVPDNAAIAVELLDAGATEYLRLVTTDAQPIILFNEAGADIDFHIEASGVADALQIQGSDGQITLGVLGAGVIQSTAGGVLSSAAVPLVDIAGYAEGSLIIGGAADWEALAEPGATGYALVSDGTTFAWDQTPAWTGLHTFAAGITFNGASGANNVTIPDNAAIAVELFDAGGLEYLRIVSTDAQPIILFNEAGADVDFHIEASGVADAFQIRGSDGQITLGALGAGVVQATAGGVLSSAAVPLVDLGGYTQGDLIYGGAADWQDLAHPGAANRVLQSTAAEVGWSANTLVLTASLTNSGGAANQVVYWSALNTLAGENHLALLRGGTGANLNATGGANQYVKQTGVGLPFTVGVILAGELPGLGGVPALTFTTANAAGAAATYVQTDAQLAIFDINVPTIIQADDAAATGAAAFAARRDHTHGFPTVAPANIGVANAEGTAYDFVRSDHVHAHPAGLGVNLHHNEVHIVNSTGPHAEAGLTIGHVLRATGAAAFSFAALIAADLPTHSHSGAGQGGSLIVGTTDTDAAATRVFFAGTNGVLQVDAGLTYNAATDSLTAGDYFTTDGGQFGISGNELLTVNAAGNFTFSGVTSVVVPDGCWIGADAACSWVFDSSNGDVTTLDKVGVGTTGPIANLAVNASGTAGLDESLYVYTLYDDRANATTSFAANVDTLYKITATRTNYVIGIDAYSLKYDIPDGETNTGYNIGIASQAFVSDVNFAGTINDLRAIWARVGINVAAGAGARTVTNAYGVYIENLTTVGTITNNWGLYQASAGADNYFAGSVGVGTASPDRLIHSEVSDAGTTNTVYPLRLSHTTSGTAADLFGVAVEYELEDAGGNMQVGAEIGVQWADDTNEVPLIRWSPYPNGTIGPGYGGMACVDSVGAAAEVLIPNGAGDVANQALLSYAVRESGGGVSFGSTGLDHTTTPNVDIYNAGGETLNLRLNVNGSVDVRRTAGSSTFNVVITGVWV